MPKKAKTSWRRYAPYIVAGVILLAFALAWEPVREWYYNTLPVQNQPVLAQVDPTCQFVERLGLRCLASPSAETLMGPGRYVRYALSKRAPSRFDQRQDPPTAPNAKGSLRVGLRSATIVGSPALTGWP